MRKALSIMLAAVLTASLFTFPAQAVETGYKDVDPDAWYAWCVRNVSDHGLMNGTGGGAFSPLDNATRAQAATILTRLHQMQQLRVQNQELLELMTRNGDENE